MARRIRTLLIFNAVFAALLLAGLWLYDGAYGLRVLLRSGGTFWINVEANDPRLSPSMRLAMGQPPEAVPGYFEWHRVANGFEAGELPVVVAGVEVDRIVLARIDPADFRFEVHSSAGDKTLDGWMRELGAVFVINGSYFGRFGLPVTPILSGGAPLGPTGYNARGGAFVASVAYTGIRDLAQQDWQSAFSGADNALVSFPLLIAGDGTIRTTEDNGWLASRSFVGQDRAGWIILGTTVDGFFSLPRLAAFLQQAPLRLTLALNLDGGPVACQGISLTGFERRLCGKYEMQRHGDQISLLTRIYGKSIGLPIVVAAFPR
jgi:hypothetical protein